MGRGLMELVRYGTVHDWSSTCFADHTLSYFLYTNNPANHIESNRHKPLTVHIKIKQPELELIYMVLSSENAVCVVSLEPVVECGEYWHCGTCNKVISWEVATVWITEHKNCPHCRQTTGLDVKYVNSAAQ